MNDARISFVSSIQDYIKEYGKEILRSDRIIYSCLCDDYPEYKEDLIAIKQAVLSNPGRLILEQEQADSIDVQKIFNECRSDHNQESLNVYLELLFAATDHIDAFHKCDICYNEDRSAKQFKKSEYASEENLNADEYYKLALAQKTQRGIADKKLYISLLNKSSEMGNQAAMHMMAKYYIKGRYVERDLEKGAALLKKCAVNGSVDSMYEIFELYSVMKVNCISKEEAVSYLQGAADKGNMAAQYDLGMLYHDDLSPEAQKKAVHWLSLSSSNGYPQAMYQLALCYRFGQGVGKDMKKAFDLLERAAALGHSKAQEIVNNK